MKTKILLTLISTFIIQPSSFGQGALTPPGAPAPTMKSLDQLEPRTPIASAPFIITNSGSYYLTTNLTVSSGNAITIATGGVTLDLNGFTLFSTAAPGNASFGILLTNALNDITIQNGHIRSGVTNNGSGVYSGPGFAYGIYYYSPSGTPVNVLVSRVSVSGCLSEGIFLQAGTSTMVESCTAHTIGAYGINASTIKNSLAVDCGADAINGDQVSDCRGESTGGYGVFAKTAINCYGVSTNGFTGLFGNNAMNCYGKSNGSGTGLSAGSASNCYGQSVSGYGIFASYNAANCNGSTTAAAGVGLYAYNASFCLGANSSVSPGRAIQATIATGCVATGGTNLITYKYNMP